MFRRNPFDGFILPVPSRRIVAAFALCAVCLAGLVPSRAVFASEETDRDALVALYRATDGDNWLENDNWLTDTPIGTWHGVVTGSGGRVVFLSLSANGLNGSIPPEIGRLTELNWLNLASNFLWGSIPPELGNLTSLEVLFLSDNQLSGSIPPELGRLTNLESLSLWGNRLSGSIPLELGNLTKLEYLNLGFGNLFSGCLPESWRNIEDNDLKELGLLFCVEHSSSIATTDRDVLIAFYQATNGASWSISTNWLTDAPLDTWYGVTTDEHGRVTDLTLSENELSGTIPPEVGNLQNLEWLDLSENELSGTIPPEVGNLRNLRGLALGGNSLSGAIPPELGNLLNLTGLALWSNGLSGSIPPEIGNLSKLRALYLSNNVLSGSIPPELGKLTNLEGLTLWNNRLGGTIPPALGDLIKLEELDLESNRLTGAIPEVLGNLTRLERLYLSDNQFSGCIPQVWRSVEENDLEDLGLSFCVVPTSTTITTDKDVLIALYRAMGGANWSKTNNWLTDAPLDTWYGVTTDGRSRVIELSLPGNRVSGAIPPELGSFSHLEWLDLSDNELSGAIPPELGQLVNLTDLYLYSNHLTGSIPIELGNITNLEFLALSSNGLSGTIPPELGNLTNLTGLVLSFNDLSGTIPPELGNLTNLTGLALSFNDLSGTIPPDLDRLTKLTLLYLSGNQFSGCVPEIFQRVEDNDLENLLLPFCVESDTTSAANAGRLTSIQVFEKVSPAIAFVETSTSTGSGVLLEEGYLVTNAHVVWPFNEARVVFPDGREFDGVPVIGWDNLADLAVLGPISTPIKPVTFTDGEDLPIGTDIYLIGYPGEFESFPQPAIGRGLLARLREWEPVGITYFQTDAIAIGGQSGGALVSTSGEVIGISGFRITEGKFGFVASSADLLPRIRQLVAGEDPSGLGDRRLPIQTRRHRLRLRNFWDDLVFVIDEPIGTKVEIELSGDKDGRIVVTDQIGEELLALDEDGTAAETGSFIVRRNGPHFLVVRQMVESPAQFTLAVNRRLTQFNDPDRGGRIQVGQSARGNMDYPGDVDHYLLQLEEDETVEILTRSALADVNLTVDFLGATGEQIVQDDDSGGGLFGLDSRVVYRAPQSGSYFLVVRDASRSAPGGYIISVKTTAQEAVSHSGSPSGFGCDRIRSSLDSLLASFTAVDPADIDRSPEDMISPIAEETYSHVAVFASEDGSQLIVAACGQVNEMEKSVYDLQLGEMKEALQLGPITERESGVLTRLQLLEMTPIGDISLGAALDSLSDGEQSRLEKISFRRGHFVISVSNLSNAPYDAKEIVLAEEVARMLDAQMNAYMSGE